MGLLCIIKPTWIKIDTGVRGREVMDWMWSRESGPWEQPDITDHLRAVRASLHGWDWLFFMVHLQKTGLQGCQYEQFYSKLKKWAMESTSAHGPISLLWCISGALIIDCRIYMKGLLRRYNHTQYTYLYFVAHCLFILYYV